MANVKSNQWLLLMAVSDFILAHFRDSNDGETMPLPDGRVVDFRELRLRIEALSQAVMEDSP